MHLKTWDSVASVSGEGAGEVGLEEGLRCLVLTTFQPGAEGGEELGVCVVAGCDCVQVKGVKVDDNGVLRNQIPIENGDDNGDNFDA